MRQLIMYFCHWNINSMRVKCGHEVLHTVACWIKNKQTNKKPISKLSVNMS